MTNLKAIHAVILGLCSVLLTQQYAKSMESYPHLNNDAVEQKDIDNAPWKKQKPLNLDQLKSILNEADIVLRLVDKDSIDLGVRKLGNHALEPLLFDIEETKHSVLHRPGYELAVVLANDCVFKNRSDDLAQSVSQISKFLNNSRWKRVLFITVSIDDATIMKELSQSESDGERQTASLNEKFSTASIAYLCPNLDEVHLFLYKKAPDGRLHAIFLNRREAAYFLKNATNKKRLVIKRSILKSANSDQEVKEWADALGFEQVFITESRAMYPVMYVKQPKRRVRI